MRFKFKDIPVEILNGNIICADNFVKDMLKPVIENVRTSPDEGDPLLNAITDIFGSNSLTDVEYCDGDDNIVY